MLINICLLLKEKQKVIAETFFVSPSTIGNIKRKKTWAIPDPDKDYDKGYVEEIVTEIEKG